MSNVEAYHTYGKRGLIWLIIKRVPYALMTVSILFERKSMVAVAVAAEGIILLFRKYFANHKVRRS